MFGWVDGWMGIQIVVFLLGFLFLVVCFLPAHYASPCVCVCVGCVNSINTICLRGYSEFLFSHLLVCTVFP